MQHSCWIQGAWIKPDILQRAIAGDIAFHSSRLRNCGLFKTDIFHFDKRTISCFLGRGFFNDGEWSMRKPAVQFDFDDTVDHHASRACLLSILARGSYYCKKINNKLWSSESTTQCG
jgi:hypothetical protein